MNSKSIRKKVSRFCREFSLKDVSSDSLIDAMEKQGYTVISFNNVSNDDDIRVLADSLGISEMMRHSKGFTYFSQRHRLVFIHEGLSETEKIIVLAHEEGHIYCGHSSAAPIMGSDVNDEYEANEFAHFLLSRGRAARAADMIKQHKRVSAAAAAVLLIIISAAVLFTVSNNEHRYYGEYYITSSGSKYHKKDCIFVKDKSNVRRMTEEEFESGDYDPCAICLP